MTPLAMAAASMHELFLALMEGGFTRDDALTVVARMMAASRDPGGE
jgi:hypothetical protein